jgi:hypothetical protein
MRRRTAIISTTALAIAGAATGLGLWFSPPSYDDIVKGCSKALSSEATKTHRPSACEGVKQDDYETLLMGWTLKHALADMPKDDQDLLDYYDDGSVNGSLTDGQ